VVPILIAALNAGGEVAADAAIALENIGEPAADAIEPLIEALANDSLEVRCNAAYAIASVAKGPKASALVKALHHENPLVCIGAGFALQKVNPNSLDSVLDVVKEGVRHESPVVRLQSVWAIGQMGPAAAPAVPDAVNAMDKLAPDPRAYFFGGPPGRYTVDPSLALVATGKMAVDPLVGALSHDLVRVRVMAAIALLSIDPSHFPKVAPILKAGMNDNDQFTSSMATQLWTQYTLSQERDLSVLVQALVDHRGMGPSPVGFLLAQRGSAAVEPLMKVLKAGDGRAARAAIRGLQQIGSPAIPPLKDAMQSEDTQIRMFAITALAGMRQPPRESLIAALDDDSYPVRRVAKYALKALAANAESRRAE
jgi:HEAT repeat protein